MLWCKTRMISMPSRVTQKKDHVGVRGIFPITQTDVVAGTTLARVIRNHLDDVPQFKDVTISLLNIPTFCSVIPNRANIPLSTVARGYSGSFFLCVLLVLTLKKFVEIKGSARAAFFSFNQRGA
jgi:hypothetical protein